jgi:hypothetical protein
VVMVDQQDARVIGVRRVEGEEVIRIHRDHDQVMASGVGEVDCVRRSKRSRLQRGYDVMVEWRRL